MRKLLFGMFLFCTFVLSTSLSHAAEKVSLIIGPVVKSIDVEDLNMLADSGVAEGLVGSFVNLGNADPKDFQDALNKEIEMDLVEMSKLLNTKMGEVVLKTVGIAIAPRRSNQNGHKALRSAIILSLADDNVLTPIEVINNYPTDARINVVEAIKLAGVYKRATKFIDGMNKDKE